MRICSFLFRTRKSGAYAKNRLQLLLVSDRANCSPEMMDLLKQDMIATISKYMVIEAPLVEIKILQTERENHKVPVLFANIPIKDMKHAF